MLQSAGATLAVPSGTTMITGTAVSRAALALANKKTVYQKEWRAGGQGDEISMSREIICIVPAKTHCIFHYLLDERSVLAVTGLREGGQSDHETP